MEENVNKDQPVMAIPNVIATLVESYTKHIRESELTIQELFNNFIADTLRIYKEVGDFCPVTLFIFRDYKKNIWKAGCYPMPNPYAGAMEFHAKVLRKLIREMKAAEYLDFKLVGVYRAMDTHLVEYKKDEIIDIKGDIDHSKFVRPRENPNSKDALQFELEEIFMKHTKAFEYIKSDTGLVYNPKPIVDNKQPYDAIQDRNSNFGFLFTEGVQQN
jgi:hypothetical protein